jgi:hypothetical protein
MAVLKKLGDLAELKVAADLLDRGCSLSIPFGEDSDYDLIADYHGVLHRVQVKYTRSNGARVFVKCRSHSLTKGKIRRTKYYTAKTVDWIAVYDATTQACYYCPSTELGTGRSELSLRLVPPLNGQRRRIRHAADYVHPDFSRHPGVEPAGFEPAASALQKRRSAN